MPRTRRDAVALWAEPCYPRSKDNPIKETITMAKYFIEVPHAEEEKACLEVVDVFLKSGSHFLTNAEWGCMDGEHKAWIILEADTKEEARSVLPPAFRAGAKIVCLNRFSMEEIEESLRAHRS
jgi:hypothetical protein